MYGLFNDAEWLTTYLALIATFEGCARVERVHMHEQKRADYEWSVQVQMETMNVFALDECCMLFSYSKEHSTHFTHEDQFTSYMKYLCLIVYRSSLGAILFDLLLPMGDLQTNLT